MNNSSANTKFIRSVKKYQQAYFRALDEKIEWQSSQKAGAILLRLHSIIYAYLKNYELTGKGPNILEFIDKEKFDNFSYIPDVKKFVSIDDYALDLRFEDVFWGRRIAQKAKTSNSYKWKILKVEYYALKWVYCLSTPDFIQSFNNLTPEVQVRVAVRLIRRLTESKVGKDYLAKNLPVAISELEDETIIPVVTSERFTKYQSVLEKIQDIHEKARFANDLVTLMSSVSLAYLELKEENGKLEKVLTDSVSCLTNVINILLEGLDVFVDASEWVTKIKKRLAGKKIGKSPGDDFDDRLEALWKGKYVPEINLAIEGHNFFRNTRKVIQNTLDVSNSLISIWDTSINTYIFFNNQTPENGAAMLVSSMETFVNVGNTPFLAFSKRSFRFEKLLKIGGAAATGMGVILNLYQAGKAAESLDGPEFVGNYLLAIGSVTGLVGIPVTLAGFGIIILGEMPDWEAWCKYNYFGIKWDEVHQKQNTYWPINIPFRFEDHLVDYGLHLRSSYERQLIKLDSIAHPIVIEPVLKKGVDEAWEEIKSMSLPIAESLGLPLYNESKIKEKYQELIITIKHPEEEKDLIAERFNNTGRIEWYFNFWDKKTTRFFWIQPTHTDPPVSIQVFPEKMGGYINNHKSGDDAMPYPLNWGDANFRDYIKFVSHKYTLASSAYFTFIFLISKDKLEEVEFSIVEMHVKSYNTFTDVEPSQYFIFSKNVDTSWI